MKDEYIKLYKEYSLKYGPNTCIFLEVGKFYEMYDSINEETGMGETSMQRAIEILGIQLSYKDSQTQIFAGIPEQSLHKFASMLTREGWTVVVVDQEKGGPQNKVIARNVSQILSPGTHIEAFTQDSAFIGCLLLEQINEHLAPRFSISIADISIGRCYSYESKLEGKYDSWNFDRLLHFFQVHPIRELIIIHKNFNSTLSQQYFKQNLGIPLTLIHINSYSECIGKSELMSNSFKNKSLLNIYDFLKIKPNTLMEESFTHLLSFLGSHFPSKKQVLEEHNIWNPDMSVYLGNNVLNQLNFISNSNECILSYFQKTFTPLGKRGIIERLLYPISDIDVLSMRTYKLEKVIHMNPTTKKEIEYCLKQISDLQRIHHKFFSYNLNAVDILNLHQSYTRIINIMNIYETNDTLKNSLNIYIEEFKNIFDIEKAKVFSDDTSFLNNIFAPITYSIENKIKEQKEKANNFLNNLNAFSGETFKFEEKESNIYSIDGTRRMMTNLDVKLKNKKKELWPHHDMNITIRKNNGSLTSSFLEEIHVTTLLYRAKLREAVKKELPVICNRISDNFRNLWLEIENYVTDIDILFTMAKVCKEKNFSKPNFEDNSNGSGFSIIGLRHPLIEAQNLSQEYVKHNVALDANGWLLYGMNASGKSSLMKAVGISILLAQVGCYVPADSLTLKPYKGIYTRILNQDNIYAGLSSFAVEMLELREILKKADQYSLVLGDELCSGTESVSATSLVASGIVWLHKKNTSFIFATHYHGLNDIPQIKALERLKIYHLKVNYDPLKDKLIYNRNLEEGPGSTYYGLEVAKAMNIPFEYLELANEIRNEILKNSPKTSQYNKDVVIKECEICKCSNTSMLEVHHIVEQKEANMEGFLKSGLHKNHKSNLIVLCSKCHDDYHAGKLTIGLPQQTSHGIERNIEKIEVTKKSKWKNEELEIIHSYLKKYSNLGLKRIVFELDTNEDIKISESSLRNIRKDIS